MWSRQSATPFQARFNGVDLWQAYQNLGGGKGEVAALPAWEYELMREMGITEEDKYMAMPPALRARLIVGMRYKEWLSALEYEEWRKEHDNK